MATINIHATRLQCLWEVRPQLQNEEHSTRPPTVPVDGGCNRTLSVAACSFLHGRFLCPQHKAEASLGQITIGSRCKMSSKDMSQSLGLGLRQLMGSSGLTHLTSRRRKLDDPPPPSAPSAPLNSPRFSTSTWISKELWLEGGFYISLDTEAKTEIAPMALHTCFGECAANTCTNDDVTAGLLSSLLCVLLLGGKADIYSLLLIILLIPLGWGEGAPHSWWRREQRQNDQWRFFASTWDLGAGLLGLSALASTIPGLLIVHLWIPRRGWMAKITPISPLIIELSLFSTISDLLLCSPWICCHF